MPYRDKAAQLAYQNAWMKRRRENWLRENGPCACGSWDELEVDHIDAAKKVTHRIWSWTTERREAELKKCRPSCKECHKAKSRGERAKGSANGMAKLTGEAVKTICASSDSSVNLARKFGVSPDTVSCVRRGITWSHVTGIERR